MKTHTFLPSLIFVIVFALAAVVCAQSPPPADSCACGPGVDAALKACESELGGTPGHPVAHELMGKCMDAKGFKRPPGPPPGFGNPPPTTSGS